MRSQGPGFPALVAGQSAGPYLITHEGTPRRRQVTANVRDRDAAAFMAEVTHTVAAQVRFPPGIDAAFSGLAEAEGHARRELLVHSLLAGAAVVLLLLPVFRTARQHGPVLVVHLRPEGPRY